MLVRITSNVLRACALLALILGIIFWTSSLEGPLVAIHMLLGILVVLSVWILGYAIATAPKGRNIGLAVGAFVIGLLLLFVGLTQKGSLYLSPSSHWIVQAVHLILGLLAIGIGEAISGRYRRNNKNIQTELQSSKG